VTDEKPKTKKEKIKGGLRRAMWLFMALLFILTGVVVGVFTFWQATHPAKDDTQQTPTNTLQGKQLSGFTPISHIDSLQKIDLKTGTGSEAAPSSTITVNYTGAVAATGTIFQSSLDSGQPISFNLQGVIKGWTEGVPGMKVGGERRLLIPAAEAYGANPPVGSGIPPNADLVFDITLLGVK